MRFPYAGFRRFLPGKIWQQIFLTLFFFAVVPLIILGCVLLSASQKAIKTAILRDYQEIAAHTTGEITEHIKGARNVLSVTASVLGRLHADPWRQETTITELSLKYPAFQRIASLNLNGIEVATSQLGSPLRARVDEPAFRETAAGQPFLSEVKVSENHMPYLTVAEPVRQWGRAAGVLVADLDLRSVWDIVDGIQVGRSGRAYLIDQKGRIIAHQDKKKVLKNASLAQMHVIQDVLAGRAGHFTEADENGEAWLVSYAPVEKMNWGLIMTRPEREAFAVVRNMQAKFLLIIALSILTALLSSLILAQYMSRPMKNIMEGSERIARGDFTRLFRVRGKSEIDRLLFAFNRMTQKLRRAQENEKMSTIGKAATAIAHELKNSLQMIDTFIKLLPERQGDKQFLKEFSDTIPRELDSWNASLKNMMTFSREDRFPVRAVDVNEIIREMMLLVKLKTRQLQIRFETRLDDTLPRVMGNEEKLKQVFLNMVTNALEATPPAGVVILTTRQGDGNAAEIEILNTGKGIDESEFSKIFEPFYSTKSGGLGLGLSISKEIIQQHKGKITVASRKDGPTSFTVRLPVHNPAMNKG